MEEYVGQLWHKLITRSAYPGHPEAAVRLEDVEKSAGIVFRALGGDPALAVRGAALTANDARRTVLQRIAGANRKVELAFRDAETLNLPTQLDVFPERAQNRDLYYWLIALAAVSVASDEPWIVRNQRDTREALARYPGLASRYRALVTAALAQRPDPAKLPADEAAQERAVRAALLEPGSVGELPAARRAPAPVHLWLHPEPPAPDTAAASAATSQEGENGSTKNGADRRRRNAERVDMPDADNPFMLFFRAESILSWAEFVKVNRATEEDEEETDPRDTADDLDTLSVARDSKRTASRVRFDLDLPPAEADDTPLGGGILLPEWHYRKQLMQPDHCRLQPFAALDAPPRELPVHLRSTARRLRRQFEALVPAKEWVRNQPDGSEIDLDACIEQAADRAAGVARERGLYRTFSNRSRDLSCLLLADLSLSTDAYVSDDARVIDVIRDSLFLFSEALSATGDRFGLYGFSSRKRDHVRFHLLKGFRDAYDAAARGRIDAIKPGYYTRMGAAIRHASSLLARERAQQRLLLILTDGKPNDLDQYEGRYGVEDTRMALIEARRQGLRPFCVTIDEQASSYLPYMFGADGYVIVRNPSELPRKLPLLYAQLTA